MEELVILDVGQNLLIIPSPFLKRPLPKASLIKVIVTS